MPKTDYDVLIITNGTAVQVEDRLKDINNQTGNDIPDNASLTYLDSFPELIDYLSMHFGTQRQFDGKVVFMFFEGIEFIQQFLNDVIDYYNTCTMGPPLTPESYFYNTYTCGRQPSYSEGRDPPSPTYISPYSKKSSSHRQLWLDSTTCFTMLSNCYYYFDKSISKDFDNSECPFNTVCIFANDILKKMNFMVGRIRCLFIDDENLTGGKIYPLQHLMINFPRIEKLELKSYQEFMFKDMVC